MELIRLKDGSTEYISNDKDVADLVEKFCGNDLAEVIREWHYDEVIEEFEDYKWRAEEAEMDNEIFVDELGGYEASLSEISETIGELKALEEDGTVEIPNLVNEYLEKILEHIN